MTANGYELPCCSWSPAGLCSARSGRLQQAVMRCMCLHVTAQCNIKLLVISSLAHYMLLSDRGCLHQTLYRAHAQGRGCRCPMAQFLNSQGWVSHSNSSSINLHFLTVKLIRGANRQQMGKQHTLHSVLQVTCLRPRLDRPEKLAPADQQLTGSLELHPHWCCLLQVLSQVGREVSDADCWKLPQALHTVCSLGQTPRHRPGH